MAAASWLLLSVLAGLSSLAGRPLAAQSCTGLCLEQVSCPNGGTTSLSGVVYAPNGVDPLPGILVYIPNGPVSAFPNGVSCAVSGQPPSGSPLAGTTTAVDGSFTLTNVPVGNSIPLVIQSGRWRRQVTVPSTAACSQTNFSTRFPQTQAEGDIPKIAVVTGAYDAVECVLRKVGVADSEFTDSSGSGRINLFLASGAPGAEITPNTPSGDTLLGDSSALSAYDVLMLPCEGAPYSKAAVQLGNVVGYANAGGRVYASHYSYDWLATNPPFNTVVNWTPSEAALPDGIATVDTSFAQGQVLSQWLQGVGATTAPGQVAISTLRHDLSTVNPPTQTWLTLNNAEAGNPVMQFTFDTPVNQPANACGRVLFNEYHVENPSAKISRTPFPTECAPGAMTAQEKLLEFSLFDLTGNGRPPSLAPLTRDFGTEPVGTTSGVQKFVWTNNTLFPVTVSAASTSGDYSVTANSCTGSIAVLSSCEIDVTFTPAAIGTRPGTLGVTSNTGTLTATLTGNAVTPLTVTSTSLAFGKVDVGASVAQTVTIANVTTNPLALPPLTASGNFAVATTCGTTIVPNGSCTVTVTFTPSTTGPQTGVLNIGASTAAPFAGGLAPVLQTQLSGTGVDFTEAIGPSSAHTVAGLPTTATSTTSPIAGFSNGVAVTCTTTAPASSCTLASGGFTPVDPVTDAVTITTTAQYTVVGYGGLGAVGSSRRALATRLLALATGLLLLRKRRSAARLPYGLMVLLCSLGCALSLTGCTGKDPAQNAPFTPAGTYTYTVVATDGFLKHSATYNLVVTAK